VALDGGRVEGQEEVVAGLAKLADGDVRRAVDHTGLKLKEQTR
jgi:hypothetical protein